MNVLNIFLADSLTIMIYQWYNILTNNLYSKAKFSIEVE